MNSAAAGGARVALIPRMHATTTKPHKKQDDIDLERAAGEGMTASPGEHTAVGDEGTRKVEPSATFQRAVALFKQRPLETVGIAFACGLVLGAGIAAIARRR